MKRPKNPNPVIFYAPYRYIDIKVIDKRPKKAYGKRRETGLFTYFNFIYMKKILLAIASTLAIFGAIFSFSTAAQAGGGPYIALFSDTGSWTITAGENLALRAKVYPEAAKITHIYFYMDNTLVQTCTGMNSCSATITNPKIGEHTLFIFAVDSSFNYYYLNGSYTQKFTVVSPVILPSVSLVQSGTAYANTTGTVGVLLQAKAHGTNLTSLKITRLDSDAHTVSTLCINQKTDCTIGEYPTFKTEEIGNTYFYLATVTDAAGHKVSTKLIPVKVVAKPAPTPSPVTPTPQLGLNPVLGATPATLGVNQTFNLNGKATNANGVWGVEVRALPSWSNVALRNRCILANKPTTGSCSMNIGSFAGHIGQTVKVWAIYWDAKTGLGYSSEMRTIRITQ